MIGQFFSKNVTNITARVDIAIFAEFIKMPSYCMSPHAPRARTESCVRFRFQTEIEKIVPRFFFID